MVLYFVRGLEKMENAYITDLYKGARFIGRRFVQKYQYIDVTSDDRCCCTILAIER